MTHQDLGRHPTVVAVLEGGTGWHRVEHLAEVTSTNDVALARIREGNPPGLVVVADLQTAGRGRAGRAWDSGPEPGSSLLCTATSTAPPSGSGLVPLAAGLAVRDAARECGAEVALKWPNDVVFDDRKAAGVLVERHTVGDGDVLLVGVGIDVDWRSATREGEAAEWTSLAEAVDHDVDRGALLASLLGSLAGWLGTVGQDRDRLLGAYRAACTTLGRDVEVARPGDRTIAGHAVDVDREGRLLLDTYRERVAVSAGDVGHLR